VSGLDGERGRNRTFNLLIKSQLLCQLSYAPFAVGKTEDASEEDMNKSNTPSSFPDAASRRARTKGHPNWPRE
jgi:hypothetical protein